MKSRRGVLGKIAEDDVDEKLSMFQQEGGREGGVDKGSDLVGSNDCMKENVVNDAVGGMVPVANGDGVTDSCSDEEDEMDIGVNNVLQKDNTLVTSTDIEDDEEDIFFEAGIILEVYMENFMNHRKFSLKLGKLVNFLTGQNGSGKSACVAAIQLCLGATASKTGRAPNMGKMIRHGSSGPAICRVKLLNEGDDAYKPDVYGSSITVERKITKQGQSTYNIYGELDQASCHDKLELERILQNFNIYVDNPCCILTQEQSKTFINGHEKEKYNFFLKATGLERICEEIQESDIMVASTRETVAASKTTKQKKYAALEELKETYRTLKALDEYEEDIQTCIAKMFWCDVEEAKKVVEEINSNKASLENNLKTAEARLQAEEEKKNGVDDVVETERKIEDLIKEQKDLEASYADATKAYKDRVLHENECKTVVQQLKSSMGTYQQRLTGIQQEISDLQAASMKDAAEAERVVLQKITQCREWLEEAEANHVSANEESNGAQQELDNVRHNMSQINRQREHIRRALESSRSELHEMQRGGGEGRLDRFGRNMTKAVNEVKATRFQSEVCGPLGAHILLKDEYKQLGSAVERCIWQSLSSFIVDNVADRTKLNSILKKHGLHMFSQVYLQTRRPRYQVQLNREIPDTVFVHDTIQVENDIIFNALVDQNRIDQVIITQKEAECDKYVTWVNGQRQFLAGIAQAATMDGRTILYKQGNKSSEHSNFQYKKLLAADTSEIIANLHQNISRDEADMETLNVESQQVSATVKQLEQQRKGIESNVLRYSKDIQRFRKSLADLQNEYADIQSSSAAGQADFASLEAEAVELQDAIAEVKERIAKAMTDVKSAAVEVKACNTEKRKLEASRKKLKAQQSELEGFIEDHINLIQGLSREVEKANREVLKCKKLMEDCERLIKEKQEVVDERVELARARTPQHVPNWDGSPLELNTKDSRESLNRRISRLKGLIEEGKKKAGLEGYTIEILSERLAKAATDYNAFKEEYSEVKRRIKSMEKDLYERQELWEKQVKHYSKMVSRNFDAYMQKRGFSGSVHFDHVNKTLSVRSQTDNAKVATRCTDLRQMSGGERSYTALCLLLALGHVVSSINL